jgi:hypothetical protein
MTSARTPLLITLAAASLLLVGCTPAVPTVDSPDAPDAESTAPTGATDEAGEDDGPWQLTGDAVLKTAESAALDCAAPAPSDLAALGVDVWGDGPYSSDSLVCVAAVHAGIITADDGGEVLVTLLPGQDAYASSTANGITTTEYGAWGSSMELAAP